MSEVREVQTRYRVLIVDDDDDVREALQDELELNYDVTAVSSGKDAIGKLSSSHYDAIISDQRMPGMSGVQVLEAAQEKDASLVRILLTGYVDDDARRAMMEDNAPYKIGKPWHDEVEVTLKRAFEHRKREHSLSSSVSDALAVAGVDNELASVETFAALAHILVSRCARLEGVDTCAVRVREETGEKIIAGIIPNDDLEIGQWCIDIPISSDGSARLSARGFGSNAKEIVEYLGARALHWSSEDPANRLAKKAYTDPEVREKLSAVSRQATLGTMTVALVHELASMVQSLQGALFELEDFVRVTAEQEDDLEIIDTLENAVETSSRMVALFRAMRTFVRSGEAAHRPCRAQELVERSIALCRGSLRSVVKLEVSEIPDVEVEANEALFLQVLVNLLRNAAEASPVNAKVELKVQAIGELVHFVVEDQGPGVPPDLINQLFDPFTSTKNEHTASGLGLAISSEIVSEHGGKIRYDAAPSGGARFTVSLPLVEGPAALRLVSKPED